MRLRYSKRKMAELFANSGDPNQRTRFSASDLGLHCLPTTLLEVSRLQWVKVCFFAFAEQGSTGHENYPIFSELGGVSHKMSYLLGKI